MPVRAGVLFDRLGQILRAGPAPDGCPWDREQTHASLRPFLLEETYEVLDAIEGGDGGPEVGGAVHASPRSTTALRRTLKVRIDRTEQGHAFSAYP
jgi:NTP pyrophosphatase (non-canonical NTP hydrolase)